MENIHHTHKPVASDWLREVQTSLRSTRRSGARTRPSPKPARWGSRMVSYL